VVTDERDAPGPVVGQRRVYRSDPGAATAAQLGEEFNRLARRVYAGVRDGAVDCEAAFELACLLMEWGPTDPIVEELAELTMEGTGRERIAELARQVLAPRFEPGFDLEPGRLVALEEALEAVKADMQATGLPGLARLAVPEWSSPLHAFVEFRGGGYGSATGIAPANGGNPVWALVAVADEAQDSVMETPWEAWPVCPSHQLGAHAQEHEGAAVWWCNGDGGHVIAAIGKWNSRPAA
jgi:hypothetical protein